MFGPSTQTPSRSSRGSMSGRAPARERRWTWCREALLSRREASPGAFCVSTAVCFDPSLLFADREPPSSRRVTNAGPPLYLRDPAGDESARAPALVESRSWVAHGWLMGSSCITHRLGSPRYPKEIQQFGASGQTALGLGRLTDLTKLASGLGPQRLFEPVLAPSANKSCIEGLADRARHSIVPGSWQCGAC